MSWSPAAGGGSALPPEPVVDAIGGVGGVGLVPLSRVARRMAAPIETAATAPIAIISGPLLLRCLRAVMPAPNDAIGSNVRESREPRESRESRESRRLSRPPNVNAGSGESGDGTFWEPLASGATGAGGGAAEGPVPMPLMVADGGGPPPDSQPLAVDTSDDRSGAGPVMVCEAVAPAAPASDGMSPAGAAAMPRIVAAGDAAGVSESGSGVAMVGRLLLPLAPPRFGSSSGLS